MEKTIILCGLGRVGWRVLEFLQKTGLPVVVIDTHCKVGDPRLGTARLVVGDCRQREILAQAGVAEAQAVLVVTSDDLVNISTALTVRSLHADVRIVLRMFNDRLIPRLGSSVGNVYALSTSILTAPLFALTALTGQSLGAFRLDNGPEGRRQVAEVIVATGADLVGQTVGRAVFHPELLVLAHVPAGNSPRFLTEVEPDAVLGPGDRLIVCGDPHRLAPLLTQGGSPDTSGVLWAGWLRRYGRMLWQTLTEVDLAVKICGAVMVGVIVLGTLVLHFNWRRSDPDERPEAADALFRTISLLATGADMSEANYHYGPSLKVFVSILRIIGAALTAAFTAIVTNYLLRARLGGALEVRRIPDGGHVIVCGLGNIGYRVVEELLRQGERVVVIELSRDSRFMVTTRRQGVPVIVGDATVREVLRQAHVQTSRAVITATSNDLVNLEVALLARDINPKQRVVLRLSDPMLADLLREAADVRLALSVPELAAPAFVAGVFGDRVLGVCLVEQRLLAVINLVVGAGDALLNGMTVRAVAIDFDLLPVAVNCADGTHKPRPLDWRLGPNDQLVAFVALSEMERLLCRESAPAEWAVDIQSFLPPSRGWVVQMLRTQRGLTAEAAENAANTLPVCLGTALTRGAAEDLKCRLAKERVIGVVRRMP